MIFKRKKSVINSKIFGTDRKWGPIGEEIYDEEIGEWRNLKDEAIIAEMARLHGDSDK